MNIRHPSWSPRPGEQQANTHHLPTEHLLVCVVLSTGHMQVSQVEIAWNLAADFKTSQQMRPVLTTRELCNFLWDPTDEMPLPNNSDLFNHAGNHDQNDRGDFSTPMGLTFLEILPPSDGNKQSADVFAIRVRLPETDLFQQPMSVIDRWQVQPLSESEQELLPTLVGSPSGGSQDKSGHGGTESQDASLSPQSLVQGTPLVINKAVVDVQTSAHGKVVVLAYADGSIEYRDRWTLEELYTEPVQEKISVLRHAGYTFRKRQECEYQICPV